MSNSLPNINAANKLITEPKAVQERVGTRVTFGPPPFFLIKLLGANFIFCFADTKALRRMYNSEQS
jgi:hypothetical protein